MPCMQGQENATPRSLGRPRRVPLAAAEGAAKQQPIPQVSTCCVRTLLNFRCAECMVYLCKCLMRNAACLCATSQNTTSSSKFRVVMQHTEMTLCCRRQTSIHPCTTTAQHDSHTNNRHQQQTPTTCTEVKSQAITYWVSVSTGCLQGSSSSSSRGHDPPRG